RAGPGSETVSSVSALIVPGAGGPVLSGRWRLAQCQVQEERHRHPLVAAAFRGTKLAHEIVDLLPGHDARGDRPFPRPPHGGPVPSPPAGWPRAVPIPGPDP